MSNCEHKKDLRDGMWICENPEFDKTLEENSALRSMLREARDFIMSGPASDDEVQIVNKISATLGGTGANV